MHLRQIKLAVYLPAATALAVVMALLPSACINFMTESASLPAGTRTPAQASIPLKLPSQLASASSLDNHRVIFTYYDGSSMQTWAMKTLIGPDTTLNDFPADYPTIPGHVFVRWIYADTSTDPVSYPEFTTTTTVASDLEVRAYHQSLPTLYYDPNGAGGPAPLSVSVLRAGEAVRLVGQGELTAPMGTIFGGWYERKWTGSAFEQTANYQAGDLFLLGCSTTLYARWDAHP